VTPIQAFRRRLSGKWRRFTIEHFGRRRFRLRTDVPYISFTFDDFPRSALTEGGRILADHGARGTYFVSLALLGSPSVSGLLACEDDLRALLQQGHELGCHTFEHLDGTKATAQDFERSIAVNRRALASAGLGTDFPVFAYPLDGPVLGIKRAIGRHFAACRGGGQTYNRGRIDLNLLKAYFVDKRCRGNLGEVARLIESNTKAGGWLIFATHDVTAAPSDYGCDPQYFQKIVEMSVRSGARVLPMAQVCQELVVA
jgi:peptidoglycan/xylan/chitin deacetylase (PgdA/CDA1 family)